jgi:hypothetical protein
VIFPGFRFGTAATSAITGKLQYITGKKINSEGRASLELSVLPLRINLVDGNMKN